MARKKSLWSELQQEMDRRQRVAVTRERSQQQMVRQLVQERERAARQAARADVAERKRQQELAHEAGIAAAKALKEELEARLAELRTLLTSALAKPPQLSFASLKRSPMVPSFDPGGLAEPLMVPAWDAFAPPLPGLLSGLVGGKARHARALEAARSDFERALAEHERAENDRVRQLNYARRSYERTVQGVQTGVREHNTAVDELEADFRLGKPDAVEEYFTQLLALSDYSSGFNREYRIAYRQEPRELVIEYRLPPVGVIPAARDFRYVKTRGEIDELARPVKEIKELYASVTHQVALRTMWECLATSLGEDIVDGVVFNGIVAGTNRATGRSEELHLISAPASRTTFAELVLDQLDRPHASSTLRRSSHATRTTWRLLSR